MSLADLPAHRINQLLKKGKICVKDVVKSVAERIDEKEGLINAYITKCVDEAFKEAERLDKELKKLDSLPPFYGIPIGVKDNICTKGVRTTCASRILEDFLPPYDATVIERLRREGAIIIGKANMDEFAMGSSNENSCWGPVRNPADPKRVPGGSSGGSAAAVACGEAIAALGSDTGGSVRQPAAFCGVVGAKPTYGRVSRYGLIAFASSLDQIGTLTKDVKDCALLLNIICGHDERDSTSLSYPVPDFSFALKEDIKGVRIGVPKEYMKMEEYVEGVIKKALEHLQSLGAHLEEVSLPHTEYVIACYYLVATAEASSNLARYDGVQYGFREREREILPMYCASREKGFGQEVKRRIMLGTFVLSAGYYDAYYLRAQKVRTLIKKDFDEAFKKVDVLIASTSPTPAFFLGERVQDPLTMYLSDIYTVSANLAGLCAISVPCKTDGLPVGLQIIGPPLCEERILQVAYAYEQTV